MLRRVEVKSDDVEQLLGEVGIVAHLEGAAPMRLQPVGTPDPMDQRAIGPQRLGEGARAPVGRVGGLLLGRHLDDPPDELLPRLRWPSAARRVLLEARDTRLGEPNAPARDGAARDLQRRGDVLVLLIFGGGQHDAGPRDQSSGCASSAGPPIEDRPIRIAQGDLAGASHRDMLLYESIPHATR